MIFPRSIAIPRGAIRNLFVALAAGAFVAGCGASKASRPACPPAERCLQYGNGSEPVSLDPHLSSGTWEDRIISDMLVGLTQDAADGTTIPGMAERWETSPDGLVWTFHLREAKWSDGVPVTAEDFVVAMRRLMRPDIASQYSYLLYFIKGAKAVNEGKAPPETLGVTALDPRTLRITLEHPAPYLPEIAKHTTMLPIPAHVLRRWGNNWSKPAHYVANGPYKLVSWGLGDYVKAVKNPDFFQADTVCYDQVFYYPTNDAISAERRVKRGELDINSDIQSNRIAFLKKQIPAYVHTHTYLGVAYLAFNSSVPAFRDKRVRQALDMAIDRDFITKKLLRGGQVSAYTFVPPGVANYTAATPPAWASWSYERRQAEARRLLAEAGYGPKHPLRIEIKHRNTPDPMLFMPAIQQDWRMVGVNATLAQNETQIAYQAYRIRDFQVADAAWVADYNDAKSFLELQRSDTGQQNYGDYHSAAFDALLDAADNEADAARRARYLAQAESIMLDDVPVAPVFFYVNKNLVNPKVTGWVDNIVDHHRTRWLCEKSAPRVAGSALAGRPRG